MNLGKWHMKLFEKLLLWLLQREENYNYIKRIYSTLLTDYFQMQSNNTIWYPNEASIIRYTISLHMSSDIFQEALASLSLILSMLGHKKT
jgi:hypothetical protein